MCKVHSPKEEAIYQAVIELIAEGADPGCLTVAEITNRAGIGKGTAYEYFDDKEEMIAKALYYTGGKFCQQLYEGVCTKQKLYDKVDYILTTMEEQMNKTNCIFRIIHVMSDNSMVSRRIRELEKGKTPDEKVALDFVTKVLQDEFEGRELPSGEKMTYLIMSVFSKILCYGMLINDGRCRQNTERDNIRRLVCQGICRETAQIMSGDS